MSYDYWKRVFDFFLACLLLFLSLPVFFSVFILVLVTSKGGAFYYAERVGFRGKMFRMCKFRTMIKDADKNGGFSVPTDDKRVTKIGMILRKTKLDELPQLWNIIRGEMSFVGPRPEVKYYVSKFNDREREILSVPQGIFDYASIKFKNEAEILEKSKIMDKERAYEIEIWPEKKRLQMKYVRERRFFTDLKIILNAIRIVF